MLCLEPAAHLGEIRDLEVGRGGDLQGQPALALLRPCRPSFSAVGLRKIYDADERRILLDLRELVLKNRRFLGECLPHLAKDLFEIAGISSWRSKAQAVPV